MCSQISLFISKLYINCIQFVTDLKILNRDGYGPNEKHGIVSVVYVSIQITEMCDYAEKHIEEKPQHCILIPAPLITKYFYHRTTGNECHF
jgi:hypothetical protein